MNNLKAIYSSLSLALLLTLGLGMKAQQDAQYSQYFWNPLAVNSAYAGSREALSITLLAREQWMGLDGAPSTQTLSIHAPLKNDMLAWGFSVIHDQIGPSENAEVMGDFAYKFRVAHRTKLSLGLKAGANFFRSGLSDVPHTDGDPTFGSDIAFRPLPNFGFGAYLSNDQYFVGLSAPKLLHNKLFDASSDFVATEDRHFFLMGGYVFQINREWKLKPTGGIKYVFGAPISVDLTANVLYKDKLWAGVMYRFQDAVGLVASYQFTDKLRFGYAYDRTLSPLRKFNSGSHELMISYDFIRKGGRALSPRYF